MAPGPDFSATPRPKPDVKLKRSYLDPHRGSSAWVYLMCACVRLVWSGCSIFIFVFPPRPPLPSPCPGRPQWRRGCVEASPSSRGQRTGAGDPAQPAQPAGPPGKPPGPRAPPAPRAPPGDIVFFPQGSVCAAAVCRPRGANPSGARRGVGNPPALPSRNRPHGEARCQTFLRKTWTPRTMFHNRSFGDPFRACSQIGVLVAPFLHVANRSL